MIDFNNELKGLFTWQKEFLHNFFASKKRNHFLCCSRRMRKTSSLLLLCKIFAIAFPGSVIYYVLHQTNAIKTIIVDNNLPNGDRIYQLAGKSCTLNKVDYTLHYSNKSIVKFMGCDHSASTGGSTKVGGNAQFIIFDEYSLQKGMTSDFLSAILKHNKGFCIYSGTPRGMGNDFYEKKKTAEESPENWSIFHKSIYDYPDEFAEVIKEVEEEYEKGLMSPSIYASEYKAQFIADDTSGYIYSKYMSEAENEGRVLPIEIDTNQKTFVSFDLGYRDTTVMIFCQMNKITKDVYILDVVEGSGQHISHYVQKLIEKGFNYEAIFFPFDANSNNLTSEKTIFRQVQDILILSGRGDIARATSVNKKISDIYDGINLVRGRFFKLLFNSNKCKKLVNALHTYQREYVDRLGTYKDKPSHDWSSHYCDSLRELICGIHKHMGSPRDWGLYSS